MSSIIKGVSNFLGITTPQPVTSLPRKRRASEGSYRKLKFRRFSEPDTPRDYQDAPYGGYVTITTTDDESMDGHPPRAGPSRLIAQPRKPISPSKLATREKIRAAAEARALLVQLSQQPSKSAENPSKEKGKQRVEPVVEYQPEEPDYLLVETGSELDAPSINPSTKKPPPMAPQAGRLLVPQKPEGWDTFTPQQKWDTKPNLRARDLVSIYKARAQEIIQKDIKEPEYALRDAEIRDSMWQIMDQMERLVREFFAFQGRSEMGRSWYLQVPPETVKIISCVASGGPSGQQGWHDLFIDEQKRRALVCAIIGNVLVEQVFQHICFGGEQKDIDTIAALQEKYRNEDGFDRNKHYARFIQKLLKKGCGSSKNVFLPANFNNHVNRVAVALETHLIPFLRLSDEHKAYKTHEETPENLLDPLCNIVTRAGMLSLQMRLDPHTVYYFEPVFKEDTFTSERMECFNFHQMQQQYPRHTAAELKTLDADEKQRRATLSDAERKRSRNDSPLTQITIMDAVCAYRLGGWEHPKSKIASPEYEKAHYQRQGVRSRLLTHAWVYCRWGRARRFENGKPADNASAHGDAWNGGFVEFNDIEGVYPWLAAEKERARAKEKAARSTAKGKDKATAPVEIARPGPSSGSSAIGTETVRKPSAQRPAPTSRKGRVRSLP